MTEAQGGGILFKDSSLVDLEYENDIALVGETTDQELRKNSLIYDDKTKAMLASYTSEMNDLVMHM